jgi:hypothetical protein
MATDPMRFISRGMPSEPAKAISGQIDATGDAVALMARGIPQALASEIVFQIGEEGTPPANAVNRLMALGMPGIQAEQVVAAIAEANA